MANTFPFGADQGGDEPGGSRKALFAALGGVLALALLGYFVVLPAVSGGGDPAQTAITVTKKPAAKKPAAKKPAAKKPTTTTTKVYQDPIAKDPFKALWYRVADKPTEVPGAPLPAVPGGPADGGTGGSDNTVSTVKRVALVKVFSRQGVSYAQVRVNDAIYTPAVGQVFAGTFKLLAVSGAQATFLYGDERFTLNEGQEVAR